MDLLSGLTIAILATDGFEWTELIEPKKALEEKGAKALIVALSPGRIKGWKNKNWADEVVVDRSIKDADPKDFDGLLLPGGVMNPDMLRINDQAIHFIKSFVDNKKPIAAICHGPWPLIDAEGVKGKMLTSWPSLKNDLINAGARWVDRSVVRDENLVTSRKPADLPDFNKEIIKLFSGN
jgi:protease I